MNLRSDRPDTKKAPHQPQLLVINTGTLKVQAFVGKEFIDHAVLNKESIGTHENGAGTMDLLEGFRKESTLQSRAQAQALQVKEISDRILATKEENTRKEYLSWIRALNPHLVVE